MAYTEGTIYSTNTLEGLLRINDANLSDVEANDVIQPTSFMRALPFTLSSQGTQHKWTVRTAEPGSAFRELNEGVDNAAGKEQTITASLKLLDASFDRDKATVGRPRMSVEQYMARESMLSLNSALSLVEYQLIRGTDYKSGGFPGLPDILDIWGSMGVDAGGSGGTRVYMLALSEDRIAGIIGGENQGEEGNIYMSDMYPWVKEDSDGKTHGRWRVDIFGWLGLQIAGSYSGAVAFNLDGTDSASVDEDLISELYTKFPSQHQQAVNAILMSREGLRQYRESLMTDLNPSPAFPATWDAAGRQIPIIVSDAIQDDESTVTS